MNCLPRFGKKEVCMPLYYDVSESRKGSRLPQDVIEYGKSYPGLEEVTGADFVIIPEYSITDRVKHSDKPLPVTAKEFDLSVPDCAKMRASSDADIIVEYAVSGALLVQRKSGMDLMNSLGERMNDALSRMWVLGTYSAGQRILLYTGNYSRASNGQLMLNGNKVNYDYFSFTCALDSFHDRGGVTVNLADDSLMLQWIKYRERKLKEYQHNDTHWIFSNVCYPEDLPRPDDPLQLPRKVSDARLFVASIPGLGVDKVNALWYYVMDIVGQPPNLYQLLQYATSYETAKYVSGWGKKSIENTRAYLGLPENWYLAMSENNLTIQRSDNE